MSIIKTHSIAKKLSEDKVKKIYKTVSNFLEILKKKFKKLLFVFTSSDLKKIKIIPK